jgi:hypothetical protein
VTLAGAADLELAADRVAVRFDHVVTLPYEAGVDVGDRVVVAGGAMDGLELEAVGHLSEPSSIATTLRLAAVKVEL